MRYVRIRVDGQDRWGVLKEDQVLTLSRVPFDGVAYDGHCIPLEQCRILPPCEPSKIVCVGQNYRAHVTELLREQIQQQNAGNPVVFLKGPNTVTRHEGAIQTPGFVQRLDYEGELAVVIGKRAKEVRAAQAADYIFGYTCANDVTARDIQQKDGQWTRAKSMDGFCPLGPWIEDGVDPRHLSLKTRLNGVVRQSADTADMIADVFQLVEFISAFMTLEPGDVILTGTPDGIGSMLPGDVVEVEIEGIGTLKNDVI